MGKKIKKNKIKKEKNNNEKEYNFVGNFFEWTSTEEQTKKAFEIDKKLKNNDK